MVPGERPQPQLGDADDDQGAISRFCRSGEAMRQPGVQLQALRRRPDDMRAPSCTYGSEPAWLGRIWVRNLSLENCYFGSLVWDVCATAHSCLHFCPVGLNQWTEMDANYYVLMQCHGRGSSWFVIWNSKKNPHFAAKIFLTSSIILSILLLYSPK